MHLHLFPPPPFHVLPILLTAALAFAAGAFFVARRGMPHVWARCGERIGDRMSFWRRSCDRMHRDRPAGRFEKRDTGDLGNSAFNEYRNSTLQKLESEAAEFRSFLEGLRRAGDAADFEAFLNARRNGGGSLPGPSSH